MNETQAIGTEQSGNKLGCHNDCLKCEVEVQHPVLALHFQAGVG